MSLGIGIILLARGHYIANHVLVRLVCEVLSSCVKVLPPLREVTQRPEQEDSLKGRLDVTDTHTHARTHTHTHTHTHTPLPFSPLRLVRLMTASGNGTEGVASEFLFVLCKENSSRLIKYTGYGNAAGLLLSYGLLGIHVHG